MLHVAQVGFHLDPQQRAPRELLRDWPSLVDVAEAAAQSVPQVSVVQACSQADSFTQRGVSYHFIAAPAGTEARARAPACVGQIADALVSFRPDVIHVHGLDFPDAVTLLAQRLPETPILIQDHASRPPRPWRRRRWRQGAAHATGLAICAREQLAPFAAARLLPAGLQVFEIPEATSRFVPADREQSRQITGLYGNPAVLWVGRLDSNKDPLTVLEALRGLAAELPELQLWCCYGSATLLAEIERVIDSDTALRPRAHLLGAVPHSHIEALMNAADLYVSASHREGSGYALIEALACGLPPVVSDIPSFRALTGQGSVGELWPAGDAKALRASLLKAAARPHAETRQRVRAHFVRELSFEALGRKLAAAYGQLLAHRR